ncbi:YafY family protein [Citrobacter sp. Res13-Lact-LER2-35-b]|uniref:helix-turn-helix transcriptional regulator n=1 Tax=Citrobacter sp. Res13-Lact-LER2-35-b TaxID=2777957 RepID=UPI001E4490EA|nr:WYL domain-containing protein [Citrobacter sp. Res13-Lact-LER2-35-b]
MDRKRKKEGQGERLAAIVIELNSSGFIDKNKLITEFCISERTIYRDLGLLSAILEHKGNGIYTFASPEKSHMHKELYSFLDGETFLPTLSGDFWNKLPQRSQEKNIIIKAGEAEHTVRDDLRKYFDFFEKAIKENRVCRFHYNNKTRLINPYKLVNQNAVWYLKGTENYKPKSFALSKIGFAEITHSLFEKDINISRMIDESKSAWISLDSFLVTMMVDHKVSWYFKRRNILPEQRIIEENKDGVILECRAISEQQILPMIQYWLPNIVIKEPIWLKGKLISTLHSYISYV